MQQEKQEGSIGGGRNAALYSVAEFYEIDRLVGTIQNNKYRQVALQFPDSLLSDAAQVVWAIQDRVDNGVSIVVLADDAASSYCCPDLTGAAHVRSDLLVHYGHACFSTTTSSSTISVWYSTGPASGQIGITALTAQLQQAMDETAEQGEHTLLLLYEHAYRNDMATLRDALVTDTNIQVVLATSCCDDLPIPRRDDSETAASQQCGCKRNEQVAATSSQHDNDIFRKKEAPSSVLQISGLKVPAASFDKNTTVLYVGSNSTRQYLNIALRFADSCRHFWSWNPVITAQLATSLPSTVSRKLNRRFYLVQRAKACTVFGILVADPVGTTVTTALRQLLQTYGRTSYTMVVGKINSAKLANFAEVECYVMVACPERALLDDDREFACPVLTPLELCMALDVIEWGSVPYSLSTEEFLAAAAACSSSNNTASTNHDDDDDAPFFSLATGKYESVSSSVRAAQPTADLASQPGQGQLSTFTASSAAAFLGQREYQGLVVQAGQDAPHVARPGLRGIASKYGE